jgi:hypothetical protein
MCKALRYRTFSLFAAIFSAADLVASTNNTGWLELARV